MSVMVVSTGEYSAECPFTQESRWAALHEAVELITSGEVRCSMIHTTVPVGIA